MPILYKWILSIIVLFVLFSLIEHFIGWKQVFTPWLNLSLNQVFLALVALFFSYAIRATRLIHYFDLTKPKEMLVCARIMLLHNFWNNLLPMRSGEASFPLLMRSHLNITLEKSLPALLWFRILDLHTLLLIMLTTFACIWLTTLETALIFFAWSSLPLIAFKFHHYLQKKIHPKNRITAIVDKLLNGFPQTSKQFYWSWLWTLFNWTVKLMILAWILSWFIQLPLEESMLGVIGGELSSVLPIHGIGGFGTYEAGVWMGISHLYEQQTVVLTAAINLHLMLLSSSILSAVLAYLFLKKRLCLQT